MEWRGEKKGWGRVGGGGGGAERWREAVLLIEILSEGQNDLL